jgi:tetratricopeptide (TPR) repeat protein
VIARGLLVAVLATAAAGALGAGNRAFRAGDLPRAEAEYRRAVAADPSLAVARYNLGTALLRAGRHAEALRHLDAADSLARTDTISPAAVRLRAPYNAGNADLGPVAAGSGPADGREARLRRAIAHYRRALRADPGDADAKWNLELAMRLLEREERRGGGGGGGGGGGDAEAEAGQGTAPDAAAAGGDAPRMSAQEAAALLDGVADAEAEVQRAKLRKPKARAAGVRDW